MPVDVICPECGGKIGGSGKDGFQPCRCFDDELPRRGSIDMSDPDEPPAPSNKVKICRVCREDVSGRARYRDREGYICVACAKAEAEGTPDDGIERVACAECGKKLKPAGLVMYHGSRICRSCHRSHLEINRKRARPVYTHAWSELEKRRIKIGAGVMGVLMLILIVKWLTGL